MTRILHENTNYFIIRQQIVDTASPCVLLQMVSIALSIFLAYKLLSVLANTFKIEKTNSIKLPSSFSLELPTRIE